jgi:KipI family sensor histidine kinase inhibitor
MVEKSRMLTAGDSAIVVEFGNEISEAVSGRVRSLQVLIEQQQVKGIIECVPTYRSLMIHYDPRAASYGSIINELESLEAQAGDIMLPAPLVTEIPTCYGGEYGPDIETVAAHNGLSVDEVIQIHTSVEYLIYMIGFSPGFPYLGGMDQRIAAPRLESPRTKIRAGSVGIAGNQTGIYPIDSPGGWQLIGWTPARLYDPHAENPILLKAGNYLKFKSITKEEAENAAIKMTAASEQDLPDAQPADADKTGFTVIKAGMLTTVQDAGRIGYQQYGVPVSGVMDSYAYRAANLLVGNETEAAVLEVTLLGPEIEFSREMVIAVTGGDLTPQLNRQDLSMWQSHLVKPGDRLSFKGVRNGCRSYIAFNGGLEIPQVMGSRSTFTRGGIGGVEGRALKAGDRLRVRETDQNPDGLKDRLINSAQMPVSDPQIIRVVPGPQDDAFTDAGISTFYREIYTVTNDSDRMGCRLEGPVIEHHSQADIISDGIAMGAVQVPGHGMPIIMMADRQTTGGYTKIATVISADLPKMAQMKPGSRITFQQVTVEEARQLLLELEAGLKTTAAPQEKQTQKNDLQQINGSGRRFRISVSGRDYEVTLRELKE